MTVSYVEPTTAERVRDALKEASARADAAEYLFELATADPALAAALLDHYRPRLLREICSQAVRDEAGVVRRRASRAAAQAAEQERMSLMVADLSQWTATLVKSFDLWTLPSGIKIKRATVREIVAAEAYHREARLDHARKERFYAAVVREARARGLADDGRAAEVLTDLDFSRLLVEAEA